MSTMSQREQAAASRKEQAVLDARIEYGHLVTTYVSLTNMFWIGYGAYFTINSLLATVLGISYSDSAAKAMDKVAIHAIHVLIPITGMFISYVSIATARMIRDAQVLAALRGRALENLLSARMFESIGPLSMKFPIFTAIGSCLFGALWFAALF